MSLQSASATPYFEGVQNYSRGQRTLVVQHFVRQYQETNSEQTVESDWQRSTSQSNNGDRNVIALADYARRADETRISQVSLGARAAGKVLGGLKNAWALSDEEFVRMMGMLPGETSVTDLLLSEATLGEPVQRERIAALANIHRQLFGLFRDAAVERRWLRHGVPLLNGDAPASLLFEGSLRALFMLEQLVRAITGK